MVTLPSSLLVKAVTHTYRLLSFLVGAENKDMQGAVLGQAVEILGFWQQSSDSFWGRCHLPGLAG
jgi:hypothetical protein